MKKKGICLQENGAPRKRDDADPQGSSDASTGITAGGKKGEKDTISARTTQPSSLKRQRGGKDSTVSKGSSCEEKKRGRTGDIGFREKRKKVDFYNATAMWPQAKVIRPSMSERDLYYKAIRVGIVEKMEDPRFYKSEAERKRRGSAREK